EGLWSATRAQLLNALEVPERPGNVREQLGLDLLLGEPRTLVLSDDLREELRREILAIAIARGARNYNFLSLTREQRLEWLDRPRCRRDEAARILTEAQPEHGVVEHILRGSHGTELVHPHGIRLWAAETVRLIRGEQQRLRAIGPDHLSQRGLIDRPHMRGRDARAQNPRRPFEHDVAHVGSGRSNQVYIPRRAGRNPLVNPLGARARLAGSAAATEDPSRPGARRRELLGPSLPTPGALQRLEEGFTGPHDAPRPVDPAAQ